jgi:hydrogenase nickel incorporation protein HypA/HybF
MHELAVTEALLKTACEYANKNDAKKVLNLNLVIGDLSGIIDDSVQFYWDMISADTICAGSVLKFEKKPAKFLCQSCQKEFTMDSELTPCPQCGSIDIKVIAGDEFTLQSIEIEK